ncbi:GDSL-type esterase/lipase family protein [Spirosoma aerolatum]|uniref:GDSL-type esterase/lipase family protein n=1 Tax=Spirosoma aerolatum TaxID=1211326 RepID=UPI0009AEC0FC|nr:GDSL-type esterase/lipase family protein [Spirosoma aerolatum]
MPRLLLLLLFPLCLFAQEHAFESEIRAFEQADKTTPPPRNPIVFTGSSSIRLWENLGNYFPNKPVLQRGFGGSQLSDVIYYADRVIVPYKPKQVVLYAGENDVAAGKTGQEVYERLVTLFEHVRRELPNTTFTFISIKPSPSRRKYFSEMDNANRLIQAYLAKQRNTQFVDIRPVMLLKNGQPVPELFRSDSLHMLPAGYERWQKVLKPYLK